MSSPRPICHMQSIPVHAGGSLSSCPSLSPASSVPSLLSCPRRMRHTVISVCLLPGHRASCYSSEPGLPRSSRTVPTPIFRFSSQPLHLHVAKPHVGAQPHLTGWSKQHFIQAGAFFKHFLYFGSGAPVCLTGHTFTSSPALSTLLRLEALRAPSLGLFSLLHSCDRWSPPSS